MKLENPLFFLSLTPLASSLYRCLGLFVLVSERGGVMVSMMGLPRPTKLLDVRSGGGGGLRSVFCGRDGGRECVGSCFGGGFWEESRRRKDNRGGPSVCVRVLPVGEVKWKRGSSNEVGGLSGMVSWSEVKWLWVVLV